MSNWIHKMKILLISSGVVSLAMAVKLALPLMYELPTVYSVLLSLFKPPYLYVIINGIIITIVVCTRFSHSEKAPADDQSQPLISAKTPPPVVYTDALVVSTPVAEEVPSPQGVASVYEDQVLDQAKEAPVVVNELEVVDDDDDDGEKQVIEKEEEDVVVSRSTYTPPERITTQETETETVTVSVPERPLALSRFAPLKSPKASPQGGRALKVARPRRQETLEGTWRMITEGRHVPLTRRMKKSDTFENHGHSTQVEVSAQDGNCSSPQRKASWGRIHKEPSLSQDELNRRVEAFIRKFNEEMRLQREESLKQYMEMINRGV